MKAKKRIVNLGLASLFVLATLLGISVTSVQAGPGDPGHWHGTPDPDACNTFNDCIYIFTICYEGGTQTLGSHQDSQEQHQLLVDLIGAKFGACTPAITRSGRCKLTDIDPKIYIGAENLFTASWLGKISSLRFRNADGFIVFVSPITGSLHFSDGKAKASFSLSDPSTGLNLVAPGKYQVSCFGVEGSVGDEIKITVAR